MNRIYKYLDSEEITYIPYFDRKERILQGSFEWNEDIVANILFSNLGYNPIELTNFEVSKQWKRILDHDSLIDTGLTLGQILLLLTLLEIQKQNLHSKDIVLSADLSMSSHPEKLLNYYRNLGFRDEGDGIWSGSELLYQNMRVSFADLLQNLLKNIK